jgi:hypothetical protein
MCAQFVFFLWTVAVSVGLCFAVENNMAINCQFVRSSAIHKYELLMPACYRFNRFIKITDTVSAVQFSVTKYWIDV